MNQDTVYAPADTLRPPPQVVAASKMIEVLGMPETGVDQGSTPVTVYIHFTEDIPNFSHVSLVVGDIPIHTSVFGANDELGRLKLEGVAPPLGLHCTPGDSSPAGHVPVKVQVIGNSEQVLDEVICGSFVYSPAISHPSLPYQGASLSAASAEALPTHSTPGNSPSANFVDPSYITRRRAYTLPTAPTSRLHKSSHRAAQPVPRRSKDQSMMRSKYAKNANSATQQMYSGTPSVEIITPLQSMCSDWTSQEHATGRRLVRFSKIQNGYRFLISFVPMSQDDFVDLPDGSAEHEGVVSCIYRQENGLYYITSVDLIYLLERLAEDDFPVEEKNRIRRNLEGLKPVTISKHKPESEAFFHRIMDFPDPKPRNIEKDLKVFEWSLLGQALQKILSKYSLFSRAPINAEDSSPSAASSVLDWEEPVVASLNPNLIIPSRREPTLSPPSISPLLSASVDQVEHDLDSDSSSASGHGWDPLLSDLPVQTFADYDMGAVPRGCLLDPMLPNDETHFNYDISDYGSSFFDLQGSVDLGSFISGVAGIGDLDTGVKSV